MSEDVKPENMRIHSRADELIACLEGEIAKRDEELAACRVAVENCEMFRARIAELEEKLAVDDDANFNLRGLLQRGAFALGLDPENTSWFEVIGELEKQRAELSAIKAQEPKFWITMLGNRASVSNTETGARRYAVANFGSTPFPVYAAPVSEAKAIIDGLRGEAADLRSMLATVSKAGLRVRTARDQHAKRIGELEGLLRGSRKHVAYAADHCEQAGMELDSIDAALSAGKEVV